MPLFYLWLYLRRQHEICSFKAVISNTLQQQGMWASRLKYNLSQTYIWKGKVDKQADVWKQLQLNVITKNKTKNVILRQERNNTASPTWQCKSRPYLVNTTIRNMPTWMPICNNPTFHNHKHNNIQKLSLFSWKAHLTWGPE